MIVILMAAILFASSGRLNWLVGWVAVVIQLANQLFIYRVVRPRNPYLTERHETAKWDKLLYPAVGLYLPVCTWLVSGLDNRFGWSGEMPSFVTIAALVITISGLLLSAWAMLFNRFYTGTVIIQKNRGHAVATKGPYKYVRHPSYTGGVMFYLALPVLLGSVWALIPSVCAAVLIVVRTILEDSMLRKDLDSYNAYAGRVKYYMIPGVW
jgi:protein-S-isoprenylcysteine O-methyltransferase Ste14